MFCIVPQKSHTASGVTSSAELNTDRDHALTTLPQAFLTSFKDSFLEMCMRSQPRNSSDSVSQLSASRMRNVRGPGRRAPARPARSRSGPRASTAPAPSTDRGLQTVRRMSSNVHDLFSERCRRRAANGYKNGYQSWCKSRYQIRY